MQYGITLSIGDPGFIIQFIYLPPFHIVLLGHGKYVGQVSSVGQLDSQPAGQIALAEQVLYDDGSGKHSWSGQYALHTFEQIHSHGPPTSSNSFVHVFRVQYAPGGLHWF